MIGAIISAVAALGSAIGSKIKSSEENKKASALTQQQRDEIKHWYDIKKGQDYTMRADVQAAINKQRELLDEQYKRSRATNVVAGGTDASLALQRESANRATADMMSNVAAQSTEYKENVENQYRAQDAALNQQQVQSHQQQAAQIAQAGSQVVNAGLNFMGNEIVAKGMKTPTDNPTGIPTDTPTSAAPANGVPVNTPSPAAVVNDPNEIRKQNA